MDIEKLENFLTFTEYMNFTAAANKAFMDPSVFHRQISSIENELDIRLIQRENRVMSLTPAGESFAKGMRSVLELYHMEVRKAEDLAAGIRGSILICNVFGHSITKTLADLISRFETACPEIRITVINKSMAESRALLQKGQVDFAVARDEDYALIDNIEVVELERIRAGFAIHAELVPSEDAMLAPSMLDKYPLIWCRELTSSQGGAFLREREQRLGPESIIWVNDLEATYSYVELKKGFTMINDLSFFRNLPTIRYIPDDFFGEIRYSLVSTTTNSNQCAKAFRDFVREQLPDIS